MDELEQSSFEYPDGLRELYSRECVAHRDRFNQRMHRYIDNRISNGSDIERAYFLNLKKYNNLLVPAEGLNGLSNSFDVITVSGAVKNKRFMFVENWHEYSGKRFSSGKTSIMLQLLGVDMPYFELEEDIPSHNGKEIEISRGRDKGVRLIISDMGYVLFSNGALCLAPVVGEQLIAQWDIARHVAKVLHPQVNFQEKRRTAVETDYLESIGNLNWLSHNLFADNLQIYPINALFFIDTMLIDLEAVFEQRKFEQRRVRVREVSPTREELRKIFSNNPCYHYNNTDFWRINLGEHRRRLEALVNGVEEQKIPRIYHFDIPYPTNYEECARAVLDVLE